MKNFIILSLAFLFISCKEDKKENKLTENGEQAYVQKQDEIPFKLTPIQHATFVMQWANEVIYVDPTGGKESFDGLPDASLVLITDIHGDHFNLETLKGLNQTFDIIAPMAVYEKMPKEIQDITTTLANGKSIEISGFGIEAVPMYNLTEERKNFHVKGRGNGYVVARDGYKVYVSGDTEDIPEMRNLENIDLAFICMNLPYTMTPEAAAEATLAFKPKKVLPYHFRGMKNGERYYYDIENFKTIVNTQNDEIEVELLEWYPSK